MKKIYKNLEVQYNKIFRHLKTGSFKTRERYGKAFKRFMVYLANRYHLQKLSNISEKHIYAYVQYMQSKDLSAATIKTELAAIRFFYDNMPQSKHTLPTNDELELERRIFGGVDRTWDSREYNLMVAKAIKLNRSDFASILTLARYAGLRLEECFRIDTNDAEKAILSGKLFVKGKSGLTRYVPINESIKIVLKKAKGTEIEHIIVLCVYYGLRRSEVLGLKWNAVNFNDNTIRICNTVTYMYAMCEKERTKNSSSNRTLPLIPVVRDYLISLKNKQEENRKLFGNCYQKSDYICVKTDGSRIPPHSASHMFSDFLKNNGFPHIRLHDLRHSCASLLIAQGVDIKIIQEWLGHSSISTTGNIYGHLQFKQKISTGIMLENLLA